MYDSSNAGEPYRREISCNLSVWHSYHMAVRLVYRMHADVVFGPLFHAVCPGQKFFTKPKYKLVIEQYFTALRLVYPKHRAALEQAIDSRDTKDNMRDLMVILRDLCEFFIPVVCACVYLVCLASVCVPVRRNPIQLYNVLFVDRGVALKHTVIGNRLPDLA